MFYDKQRTSASLRLCPPSNLVRSSTNAAHLSICACRRKRELCHTRTQRTTSDLSASGTVTVAGGLPSVLGTNQPDSVQNKVDAFCADRVVVVATHDVLLVLATNSGLSSFLSKNP